MTDPAGFAYLAAGFGAGIALTGGAYGISKLAAAALDGSARQPEALGGLRVSMIIAAALIEGLGFFALVVCLLLSFKTPTPTAATTGSTQASGEKHG